MNRYIIFISLLFSFACSNEPNSSDSINKKDSAIEPSLSTALQNDSTLKSGIPDFDLFLNVLDIVDLPLKAECGGHIGAMEYNGTLLSQESIAKYSGCSSVKGILMKTEKFVAIIYLCPSDVSWPIIVTSNYNGTEIDRLPFYGDYCSDEEFSQSTAECELTKDGRIISSDNAVTYERDKYGDIINSTRDTVFHKNTYTISESGKFVKAN
ncbi:MAG TPA: hypothetical protein VNW06_00860 [Cytophagaceae bacterium]|nr:hypothetical protein [Cytophagaceae bacterium]